MTMQKKLEKEIHSTPSSEEEEYISSVAESLPSSLSMSDRDAAPVDASDSDSEATVEEREATSSSEDEESDSNDQAKRKSFEDLGLNKWLIETLQNVSITRPSEIQEACIPAILQGRDFIGSAKTGSGKTAAFALPILQSLAQDPFGVFGLILTPTRELAFQIAEQFRVLGTGINLKQTVIVGGMDMMQQAIELSKRPHIVVATPGRLVDHIRSSSNDIHFKRVKFLVLDEADRMLDDTFAKDLEVILKEIPKKRQNLLFSATMTPDIEQLQFSDASKPLVYQCCDRFDTVDKLDQRYIFFPSGVRDAYLTHLLREIFSEKTVIIFTGKCRTAEHLRVMLKELGIRSATLHGQMSQSDRLSSLAKFKSGIIPILIATDVGSRGLDIPTVQLVINYEVPANPADYIHRIGRTARAGRGGMSLSLVTEKDIHIVLNIESKTGKKMVDFPVPEAPVLEILNAVGLAKRTASLRLDETKFGLKSKRNRAKKDDQVSHKKPSKTARKE